MSAASSPNLRAPGSTTSLSLSRRSAGVLSRLQLPLCYAIDPPTLLDPQLWAARALPPSATTRAADPAALSGRFAGPSMTEAVLEGFAFAGL